MQEEHIWGWHAVLAVLQRSPERVLQLWLDEKRQGPRPQAVMAAAQQAGIAWERVGRSILDSLAGDDRHQGVIARCRTAAQHSEQALPAFIAALTPPAFLLVLDGVQDPHNLGACLRSAEAAGVQAVILPRDKASPLTPVARKAASGAAESLPLFQVTNLARTLEILKKAGIWLVGASGEAEQSLYATDLQGPLAMVLGGEGKGLRRLTREHCDFLVRIPMAGQVASLNVSVATGICLFEACRQRQANPSLGS